MPHQYHIPARHLLVFLTVLTLAVSSGANMPSVQADGPVPQIALENLDGLPYNDRLVFQRINAPAEPPPSTFIPIVHDTVTLRIKNSGGAPLVVNSLAITGTNYYNFRLLNGSDTPPFTLAQGEQRDVAFKFVSETLPAGALPSDEKGVREARLLIGSNDPLRPTVPVNLVGFNQLKEQGNFEPSLGVVAAMFGYTSRVVNSNTFEDPFYTTAITTTQDMGGDEIIGTRWLRANSSQPVTVRQIAALHGSGSDTFIIRPLGSGSSGGGSVSQAQPYYQSLLPLSTTPGLPAQFAVSPIGPFEIEIARYTSTRSERGAARALLFFPLRDRSGVLIPNSYLVGQDFVGSGANNDFQDNIYLVTNVKPVDTQFDRNLGRPLPGSSKLVFDFTSPVAGTLLDRDGEGIGFDTTQRNKVDFGFQQRPLTATYAIAQASSYSPTLLELNPIAGTLVITSSGSNVEGDRKANTKNGDGGNTLVNGLCAPFDGRSGKFKISTRLLPPFTNLTPSIKQAGVMFGPSQHDIIRLTVGTQIGQTSIGGQTRPWVHLSQEVNNTLVYTGTFTSVASQLVGATSLDLELTADATTGRITAGYSISGGTLVALPDVITLSGPEYYRFFERQTAGCILASSRDTTPFTTTFDSFAIERVATPQTAITRIDVGSNQIVTTSDGTEWQPDTGLFSPASAIAEPTYTAPAEISGTERDPIYKTYRGNVGNVPLEQREITYTIEVGNRSTVDVALHFAELCHGVPGSPCGGATGTDKRVFDIFANGKKVLEDFDIVRAAGGSARAVVLPIEDVPVVDGKLVLRLKAETDYSALMAIEVFEQPNVAPFADAGPNRTVSLGRKATLEGSGSDPNGDTLTYNWTQTNGPPVALGGMGASRTFTPTVAGAYGFTLTVTDTSGLAASDSVMITALNSPPSVDAGNDFAAQTGRGATLSAVGTDPDDDALTYSWVKISGPAATLSGVGASRTFTPTVEGDYVFMVTATDTGGLAASDSVLVSVTRRDLRVDALASLATTTGQTVTLGATGSDMSTTDPVPAAELSYRWTQTGGLTVTLSDTRVQTPTFVAPTAPTTLTFQVVAADPFGATSDPDAVTVTVRDVQPAGLQALVGRATVGQPVMFTATVEAGSNVVYSWNFGDSTGNGNPISHTFGAVGTYVVTATATNSRGSISTPVSVAVTNLAPTASAGADSTVAPSSTVTLEGSGSDPDGHTPLAFGWQQVGGTPVTLANAGTAQAAFTAPASAGVLTFSLTVSDSFGLASEPALVTVTVTAVQPPGEAPSQVQIITSGSGTPLALGQDVSFRVTAIGGETYTWDFGDGSGGSGASVSHAYRTPGDYTVRVTVTNATGSTTSSVVVSVRRMTFLPFVGGV